MAEMNTSNPVRYETDDWHAAYGTPEQIEFRRKTISPKLKRFGIDQAPKDARILDMCCGHGEALEVLASQGFTRLEGFDQRIHEPLKSHPAIPTYEGNAAETGLPSESYDWIMNIHSMHHLGDVPALAKWVEEMRRILKPGGRFSIVDFWKTPWLMAAMFMFRQRAFHMTPYIKAFGDQVIDEWHFLNPFFANSRQIMALLKDNGFEIERLEHDPWYFYLTLRKPA
jgi:ubiquinone/menaquinone biosynthesis C-methylase UbiE